MATWYTDLTSGSSGNNGTSFAQAKKTIAQAQALASSGDTIEIYGTYRPALAAAATWNAYTWPTISSASGLTFHFNDVQIRGDTLASEITAWTDLTGGAFEKTIQTGLYIDACFIDYENTAAWYSGTNGTLIPNRDLKWVSSRATCLSTVYSWFYNSGTGLLTVNTGALGSNITVMRGNNRATPYTAGNGTVEYNGLFLGSCSDCTFTGTLTTHNLNKYSNTAGYGIFVSNGTNLSFSGLRNVHHGCGYHGYGGAGSGSQTGIIFANSLVTTCGPTSTHIVIYGDGNNAHVDGCDISGFEIHLLPHLNPDNNPVQTPVSMTGCYAHTGGPGSYTNNTITNLKYHDGTIYGYGYASTQGFSCANLAAYTGDNWDENGRACTFQNINYVNGTSLGLSWCPLIKDCTLSFASAGSSGASSVGAVVVNSSPSGDVSRNCPIFAGCVIRADLGRGATSNFFNTTKPGGNADLTDGDGPVLKNCTVIDETTNAQNNYMFILRTTTATQSAVHARGCAFIVKTKTAASSNFCGNDNVAASFHDFATCAYIGISTTAMSDNASFNTQAEWTSVVETGTGKLAPLYGTSYTAVGFVSTTTGEILKTSVLKANAYPSNRVLLGRNKAPFSGVFGAWQFGQLIGRVSRTWKVSRLKPRAI